MSGDPMPKSTDLGWTTNPLPAVAESTSSGSEASLSVGDRVWFAEEKMPYTVQAAGVRYAVCTKPFAARRTVLYSIVDRVEQVRGPENLIFGMGAETREQCEQMLARLEAPDDPTEVSHRRQIPLVIRRVQIAKGSDSTADVDSASGTRADSRSTPDALTPPRAALHTGDA